MYTYLHIMYQLKTTYVTCFHFAKLVFILQPQHEACDPTVVFVMRVGADIAMQMEPNQYFVADTPVALVAWLVDGPVALC